MKKLVTILLLISCKLYSQDTISITTNKLKHSIDSVKSLFDSVRAKVKYTAENTIVYKVKGYKETFISFDCSCDSLKRGDIFFIPRKRFDSLLKESKPVFKNKIEN